MIVVTRLPPGLPFWHPACLVGLLLFRLADIVKPWPARWADRGLKDGLGAMLDDMLAALYSGGAMFALRRWVL